MTQLKKNEIPNKETVVTERIFSKTSHLLKHRLIGPGSPAISSFTRALHSLGRTQQVLQLHFFDPGVTSMPDGTTSVSLKRETDIVVFVTYS